MNPIGMLIEELADSSGLVRQRAREQLVSIGKLAAPALIRALTASQSQVRWEAAKALSEIGDPAAAVHLVGALEDERTGVRWLAAKGLAVLGKKGLRPLLRALISRADSIWLRQGAHYVLRKLAKNAMLCDLVLPVLLALEGRQPTLEVPLASEYALTSLELEEEKGPGPVSNRACFAHHV